MAEQADLIGLSGLITPSLEEMRVVATEMERAGLRVPLLIGGATTSRAHTAVKLEPAYSGPVVHVEDASRAVGVAGALLDPASRDAFVAARRAEYAETRRGHEQRAAPDRRASLAEARSRRLAIDWSAPASQPPRPSFLGARTLADHPIVDLVPRIDWTPFFATWELRGRYPDILADAEVGRRGPRPPRGRAWRCCSGWPTTGCCGPMPWWASGLPTRPPTTTSCSGRTRAAPWNWPACTRCASRWCAPTTDPTWPWPTSARPWTPACSTTWEPSL